MKATSTKKTGKAPKKSPAKKLLRTNRPKSSRPEIAESYDRIKHFEGKQYTGMQVGRSHKWYYDKGEWKDTKITPDLWSIAYSVTKRRAGKAPKGSGAAIGTGYHWFIVAHQRVLKLNEDDYSTELSGLKFKLAHQRADKGTWNATAGNQRKRAIQFLQDMITQLEKEPVPIELEYKGTIYKGEATPILQTAHDGMFDELDVTLNNEPMGIIRRLKNSWKIELAKDQKLVDAIGEAIGQWYAQ